MESIGGFIAVFYAITVISIICSFTALVICLQKKKRAYTISLFVSTIAFHAIKLVDWQIYYLPATFKKPVSSSETRNILLSSANILVGQILISIICIFNFSKHGQRVNFNPLIDNAYFYTASFLNCICLIIAGILSISYGVMIRDSVATALLIAYMVGMSVIFCKYCQLSV
jgi:hypothetical protein